MEEAWSPVDCPQDRFPTKYEESRNTVVKQEAAKYNKLLSLLPACPVLLQGFFWCVSLFRKFEEKSEVLKPRRMWVMKMLQSVKARDIGMTCKRRLYRSCAPFSLTSLTQKHETPCRGGMQPVPGKFSYPSSEELWKALLSRAEWESKWSKGHGGKLFLWVQESRTSLFSAFPSLLLSQ